MAYYRPHLSVFMHPIFFVVLSSLSAFIHGGGQDPGDFDAVLAEVEAAQVQLVNGRPDAFKALWSRGDDVTLVGGLGGTVATGWTQVS